MSNMSLTKEDLYAIEGIVTTALKKESDFITQSTMGGFLELGEKIDRMDDKLTRVELKQDAEVNRADEHGTAITRLNRELGLQ